ncbi:Dehydrocurvularin biosynthesis regulator [Exophiala dermatitidis]
MPQRPVLAHEMMTMPYTCLSLNDRALPSNSFEIPHPTTHPVLIAKHMLLLASLLQHLHPEVHAEIKGLSETPQAMSARLANLAIDYVTTKDELLGSMEGLECIMMESVYQANLGNLRRSWVAGRRAVTVAQLMGLNRSDNRSQFEVLDARMKYDPRVIWSRIVFLDRFLCLMLGLPQGCTEKNMGFEALLTGSLPLERLERIHCAVASRVLERNELEPSAQDLSITRTLDLGLQKAARSVPSKWWLTPKLDSAGTDSRSMFWDTGRLFAQVLHYNLLNQLHLPYMLRSSMADRKYEYSRITCVNASREILTRFISLRSFNGIASSCRIIDFLALMASITLLLAHLDSYHLGTENLLAHQYHSDRAMIEQVHENFREVNSVNSDALSAHSADLLQRLLAIEAESTHGFSQFAGRVSVHKAGTESSQAGVDDEGAVSVHVPYFGVIRITREGMSTMPPQSRSANGRANRPVQSQTAHMFNETFPRSSHADSPMRPPGFEDLRGPPAADSRGVGGTDSRHAEAPVMMHEIYPTTPTQTAALSMSTPGPDYSTTNFTPQHMADLADPLLRQEEYPGLAAGTEDWAFQGVDLAFFDSLMRTTGNDGNGIADSSMVGEESM